MPKSSYTAFEFAGFDGGLNTEIDGTSLEPNELAEALNVRIGDKGEVERRTGYSRYDNSLLEPVTHLHRWVQKDFTDNLLVIDTKGDLWVRYEANPYSFRKIAGIGTSSINDPEKYPVAFAAGEDKLYISTLRHGDLRRWDGVAMASVTAIYKPVKDPNMPDDLELPTYIKPPVGRHMVYRHGRLFVAHTTANKSRLHFSDYLQPERFKTEAWIDLDPEDGSTVNAMVAYEDSLFLFKDNSLWQLTGRDQTTYQLRTVDKLRGCYSPLAVCQMRGVLIFFDRDSGVWAFDGSTSTLISQKINKHLLSGLDYSECHRAAAYFGDDRLYLSVPWEGDTTRTFVMNAQNGAWSEYDSGFSVGSFHEQMRLQGYEGRDGLYLADPSLDTIDSTAYVSKMRTPWVFPGGPGIKARMRRLELVVDAVPTDLNTFTIDLYRDLNGEDVHISRMFHTEPFPFARSQHERAMHEVTLDGWGKRFHSMQLAVTMSGIPSQLNRMSVLVTAQPDERGERRA